MRSLPHALGALTLRFPRNLTTLPLFVCQFPNETRWLYPTARRKSKTCSRGGLPLFIPAGMPIFSISFQPTGQPPVFPRRQPCFSFLSRRFSNGPRRTGESSVTACPDPRIIGSTTRRVRHDDDGLTRRVKQAYIKMKTTT